MIACSPFNPMSKTLEIFADLDRFLGRHAVLSDSVGRHKHFFSLQIQQTSFTCNNAECRPKLKGLCMCEFICVNLQEEAMRAHYRKIGYSTK